MAGRSARGGGLRAATRPPAANEGDRRRAREDGRRWREDHSPTCCAPTCCRKRTIAPRELRDLSDLLHHWVAPTRMRSALKQRVGAIQAKHGIARPYSNLFGSGRGRFLAELELRRRLDSLLTHALLRIAVPDRMISASAMPSVPSNERCGRTAMNCVEASRHHSRSTYE